MGSVTAARPPAVPVNRFMTKVRERLKTVVLHMPAGGVRAWAEEVLARLPPGAGKGGVSRSTVHWAYLEEPEPPPEWPLGEGRWVISSPLDSGSWRFPPRFVPDAAVPPFEDPDRAAAAITAVSLGWSLRIGAPEAGTGARGTEPIAAAFDRADAPFLSARELTVLEEIARGEPNKRIAANLGLSESTVRFHVRNVYRKLGAANRAEAVARAYARGLLVI